MDDNRVIELLINGDINLNDISERLKICAFREKIYAALHVKDNLSGYAELLRHLVSIEMKERYKNYYKSDDELTDATYNYEDLYWCIFLISRLRDVADIKLLWAAKHIDFDASVGVDIQLLVGAGLDETIFFLKNDSDEISKEILEYILSCKECGDFDDLDKRYNYYYSEFGT